MDFSRVGSSADDQDLSPVATSSSLIRSFSVISLMRKFELFIRYACCDDSRKLQPLVPSLQRVVSLPAWRPTAVKLLRTAKYASWFSGRPPALCSPGATWETA